MRYDVPFAALPVLHLENNLHESFQRAEIIGIGSDRAFGLFFSTVFAIIAAWPGLNGSPPETWALIVTAVLVVVSLVAPAMLRPAKMAWFMFGNALAIVVSPLALALLYYGAFVPTGFLMRLVGKDPLRRQIRSEEESYWIEHKSTSKDKRDMRDQF